jgi:hypothetical protein
LPGHEASFGRVAERLHGLQTHDDDERRVGADKLDLAVKSRRVNDARADEGVQNGTLQQLPDCSAGWRRSPQTTAFPCGNITLESGDPFLIIE